MTLTDKVKQEEALRRVEHAFDVNKVEYLVNRSEKRYDIPNLHLCVDVITQITQEALQGSEFYVQIVPDQEMRPKSIPEYLSILHRDERQYR